MKKVASLMVAGIAASWLGFSPVLAADSRAAKIKRLRAEVKMAQLNAQAGAERVAADEEAWRKTKSAAKGAACVAGGLYAGSLVGAACYAHTQHRQKSVKKQRNNGHKEKRS